ncbi:MAG: molybdopterin-guanine dinucleotide biosynthesis protein MobB, partial [Promethearchaeota archaeon]
MIKIKIVNLIGLSGSGKTFFISKAIKLLKLYLNYDVAVIKNVHDHQIDEEGKDSFIYSKAGAVYSVTKNIYNETVIFNKKELAIETIIEWLIKGPYKFDLVFTEGFRSLEAPTIICLKELKELKPQYNENIKMISGLICVKNRDESNEFN